jgi:hypothetical protein
MTRPRREFSPAVKREIYARSGGHCEIGRFALIPQVGCGAPLGPGNTFYEHLICDDFDMRPGSLTAADGAVYCKTCWRLKTDTYDKPTIAHTRRMGDKAKNIKAQPGRSIIGTKRSGIKLRIGKPPIDRATGRVLGSRLSR